MANRGRWIVGLIVSLALWSLACAQAPQPELTPAQDRELRIWSGQLADQTAGEKVKQQAAELLLDRSYPQATKALVDFLNNKENRAARIAVADGIARNSTARADFVEPLLAMLEDKDALVRTAAGKALVTYKNHGVLDRLVAIARDAQRDRTIRLDTLAALQNMPDKRVVEALVGLLRDSDAVVAKAAIDTLPKVTNIYGYTAQQWEQWWVSNKDKTHSEWLADWSENLAKRSRELEDENAELHKRLAQAMEERYAATPAAGRPALLTAMLKDPVADVQLSAVGLISASLSTGAVIAPELQAAVRGLLADDDPRIRRESAALSSALGDKQAVATLLERLEAETVPTVRQAVLTALGQLGDPAAAGAVIQNMASQDDAVAAAAAIAMERLAGKTPMQGTLQADAVKTIQSRYGQVAKADRTNKDAVALLEALIRAMGTVGGKEFLPVVQEMLKDQAAILRLAAVNALSRLGDDDSAALLIPLMADPDRGVRRAAIVTCGALGGQEQLAAILARTRPGAEADVAVRQQAWDVAMGILDKADPGTLVSVSDALKDRLDARDYRVKMLEMLVDRLKDGKDKRLAEACRQLGLALQAVRPAEAAEQLSRAYAMFKADKDPQAQTVWTEWLNGLYAVGAASAVKAIAEQQDPAGFAKAIDDMNARIAKMQAGGDWTGVVALAQAARKQLGPRLSAKQLATLNNTLADAQDKQLTADKSAVTKLAGDLGASDAAVRQASAGALQEMGQRAVRPLLEELKGLLSSQSPSAEQEKGIVGVLTQLAPTLKGYDLTAAAGKRLATVEEWLKQVQ